MSPIRLGEVVRVTKEGRAGILAQYAYKYLAAFITYIVLRVWPDTSPNTVTLFSLALSLALTPVALFNPMIGATGYLLLEILDSVDGAIARLKNMSTVGGALLDWLAGIVRHTLLFLAILYAASPHGFYEQLVLTLAILMALKYRLAWAHSEIKKKLPQHYGLGEEATKSIRLSTHLKRFPKNPLVVVGLTGDVQATITLIAALSSFLGLRILYTIGLAFLIVLYIAFTAKELLICTKLGIALSRYRQGLANAKEF